MICACALVPKASAQSSSPFAAEKVQAKEAAVAAHAEKKKTCKAEAKNRGLHLKKRLDFVRDCMAAK